MWLDDKLIPSLNNGYLNFLNLTLSVFSAFFYISKMYKIFKQESFFKRKSTLTFKKSFVLCFIK